MSDKFPVGIEGTAAVEPHYRAAFDVLIEAGVGERRVVLRHPVCGDRRGNGRHDEERRDDQWNTSHALTRDISVSLIRF
ncbi:hypothetical protein [Halobaculum rubrum]|uniref:hypothetical protein n=1 Tax=Halobaculum rubrum TaxID=2872158 RepID=UPI001CEC2272|nr:hypothetical protein [Halobaculum rubrum]